MEKQEALKRLDAIEKEQKELRTIIENADKPKDIKDRVKSLKDACIETGRNYSKFIESIEYLSIDTQAYEKLKVWIDALNEGERITRTGYSPYFDLSKKPGSGFFSSCFNYCYVSRSYVSSRLKLKNSDLAIYCGKQAEQTWYDYILG